MKGKLSALLLAGAMGLSALAPLGRKISPAKALVRRKSDADQARISKAEAKRAARAEKRLAQHHASRR